MSFRWDAQAEGHCSYGSLINTKANHKLFYRFTSTPRQSGSIPRVQTGRAIAMHTQAFLRPSTCYWWHQLAAQLLSVLDATSFPAAGTQPPGETQAQTLLNTNLLLFLALQVSNSCTYRLSLLFVRKKEHLGISSSQETQGYSSHLAIIWKISSVLSPPWIHSNNCCDAPCPELPPPSTTHHLTCLQAPLGLCQWADEK